MSNHKWIPGVIASVVLSIAQLAHASPISYGITISGGTWSCAMFRPMKQACPGTLSGSIVVDSSKATFAEQFIGFSLPMVDGFAYTDADLWPHSVPGAFVFDESGALVGFGLNTFIRQPNNSPDYRYAMQISADEVGGRYRFGDRSDPLLLNECRGCVAIAVPEPGMNLLLVSGIVMTLIFASRRRRGPAGR